MNKRLLSISDRHDKFLVEESKRLDISISGLIRGILEAHMNSDYKGKPKVTADESLDRKE